MLAQPVVDIAGIAVRLAASDRPRAHAVAALFRHAERVSARPCCVVEFTAEGIECPTAAPTVVDHVEVWRPHPTEMWLRIPVGLVAHATPDQIVVGGDAASLDRAFRFIGYLALTHLLAQHGKQVLHAGAVVSDGQAILVVGDSGSGKSTLVLSALDGGWRALSDDMVAVHRDDGLVLASGVPRPISVPDDVFSAAMPDGRPLPGDVRGRRELPAASLARGTYPVGAIVVTSHGSDADANIEPMRGHDTLRVVLRASTSLIDPAIFPEVFAVAGALARIPAWSLAHGSNPVSRVDTAAHQLEVVRSRLRDGAPS